MTLITWLLRKAKRIKMLTIWQLIGEAFKNILLLCLLLIFIAFTGALAFFIYTKFSIDPNAPLTLNSFMQTIIGAYIIYSILYVSYKTIHMWICDYYDEDTRI